MALSGIAYIEAERERQIRIKGFSAEHDKQHRHDELAQAAACYAMPEYLRDMPRDWPWQLSRFKPDPEDRIHELAKAGALIAAEIDRLQEKSGIVSNNHDKAADAQGEEFLLASALTHYGLDNQLMLMQEEFAEAITAISHYRRKRENGREELAEELADVGIVLDQLKQVFGEDIQSWREKKLKKLRTRIGIQQ